jgi:hypothetical protein
MTAAAAHAWLRSLPIDSKHGRVCPCLQNTGALLPRFSFGERTMNVSLSGTSIMNAADVKMLPPPPKPPAPPRPPKKCCMISSTLQA